MPPEQRRRQSHAYAEHAESIKEMRQPYPVDDATYADRSKKSPQDNHSSEVNDYETVPRRSRTLKPRLITTPRYKKR
jgi:hypothetical protein